MTAARTARWLAPALFGLCAAAVRAGAGPCPAAIAGGIQVNEPDHDAWTAALRDAGMNAVAVTVYAKQGAWDSAHLWWEDDEPAVIDEMRRARAKNLAVVLILRVALDHAFAENEFLWHGMIMPRSPEEIRAWFAQYGRFVLKWARIADEEGVAVLGIGSEMKSLAATLPLTRWGNFKLYHGYVWYERRMRRRALAFADELAQRRFWVASHPEYETLQSFLDARLERTTAWAHEADLRPGPHTLGRVNERRRLIDDGWIDLIRQVRGVYGGRLTYAANFDNYRNVGFWSHLDLIGINGYFSLRGNLSEAADPAEQPQQFRRRWASILERIRKFKAEQGIPDMPFLFTELGYTFRRHSTVEPWAHGGYSVVGWKGKRRELVVWSEQPVDYGERQAALAALADLHDAGGDDFLGVLYWKLSTDRAHEAIEPFVVEIGPDSTDGSREALARFATAPRHVAHAF